MCVGVFFLTHSVFLLLCNYFSLPLTVNKDFQSTLLIAADDDGPGC